MEQKIEAILFYKNEPIEIKRLISILETDEKNLMIAIDELQKKLVDRGICLVKTEKEISLGTNKEMSWLIEKITKEEMNKEIGKAGLETLAIILYNKNGVSRREIDYIRGVNSTFILRNLRMRGLIEKTQDFNNQKNFVYKPTISLLAHIGIIDQDQMPDFLSFSKKIEEIKEEQKSKENQ